MSLICVTLHTIINYMDSLKDKIKLKNMKFLLKPFFYIFKIIEFKSEINK